SPSGQAPAPVSQSDCPKWTTAPHGAVSGYPSMACSSTSATIVDNFKEFDFRHKYSLSQTFLLLYGFLHTASLNAFFKTIEGTS
ncbi:hypothetical protein, partial [Aeromonas caviae]|uniref:hypothetical protein n=1 Tax=Aeromonas caviae TaxID=648 RepID=UPI0019D41C17